MSRLDAPGYIQHKGKISILCLGDSYTYGLGVKKSQSYPMQLEKLLSKNIPGKNIMVVNCGRPGMNTPVLADRTEDLLDFYRPNVVLLMIGINDKWNLEGFISLPEGPVERAASLFKGLRIYRFFRILSWNLGVPKKPSAAVFSDNKKNIAAFLKAIEKQGDLNKLYYNYAVMRGNEYRRQEKYKKAKLFYDYASKMNPAGELILRESSRFYVKLLENFVLGVNLLDNDNIPDGMSLRNDKANISKLLKEIEKAGGLNEFYYYHAVMRANEFRKQNKYEEAKLFYNYALKIHPGLDIISVELTRFCSELLEDYLGKTATTKNPGAEVKALDDIRSYLESINITRNIFLSRGYFEDFIALSNKLILAGLFKEDLLLLSRAFCEIDDRDRLFNQFDELFIRWDNLDYSIGFFSWLTERYPANKQIILRLARAYKAARDFRNSVKYFKEVLEIDADNQEAIDNISSGEQLLNAGNQRKLSAYKSRQGLWSILDAAVSKDKKTESVEAAGLKTVNAGHNPPPRRCALDESKTVEDIAKKKLKYICRLCKERKIKMFLLSYPLFLAKRTAEAAEEEQVQLIDLRRSFFKKKNKNEYFLPDGHCTQRGNRIIASVLAAKLRPPFLKQKLPDGGNL